MQRAGPRGAVSGYDFHATILDLLGIDHTKPDLSATTASIDGSPTSTAG